MTVRREQPRWHKEYHRRPAAFLIIAKHYLKDQITISSDEQISGCQKEYDKWVG